MLATPNSAVEVDSVLQMCSIIYSVTSGLSSQPDPVQTYKILR